MRATFIKALAEIAERDDRIMLLTADLGYTVLEEFAGRFPTRFFNVGVAEQNMLGVATGLAEAGFIPFVYSIATFATLRPYEFIRNGPILHQLPVRIVGVGGGFEYGTAGPTHHAVEDVGVLRLQPGITVIAPADYRQARTALHATWAHDGPVYYRLGKDEQRLVPGLDGAFSLGRAQLVRDGDALLIVVMGSVAPEAVAAAEELSADGIECAVLVVASVSPVPEGDLIEQLSRFRTVLTVEAHFVTGGVGSLVAEVAADNGLGCRIQRHGVKSPLGGSGGSEAYLLNHHGISRDKLREAARTAVLQTVAI